MRKKNPNFNEDNKTNRSDSKSSENRRSSGGRRSSGNDRSRRDNRSPREDRPSRDGKPFSGKRRGSGESKYASDRSSSRNERPNRDGDSRRESKPYNEERRRTSDRRPSRNERPDRADRRQSREGDSRRESRPFNEERRGASDRRPSRNDRPDRADRKPNREGDSKRESRPFNEKRSGTSDRSPFRTDRPDRVPGAKRERKSFGNREAEHEDSSEKRPFRMDRKPESRDKRTDDGNKRPRKDYKKFRVNKRRAEVIKPDDGLIRLNKYVANAGICSRRQADEYIKTGVVEVNGVTITEMGFKVKPEDDVRFDGERISPERKAYVLLNKPKGFITTTQDEKDRKTVMELVANATKARLFPVGRLDRQTTGVLLFTNDGHLAKKLTHPSHGVKKIYHVMLDQDLHGDDMEKIRNGIAMQEGVAKVDKISFIDNKPHNEVGVEIHIGWNRVVRRIFEKLGYKIMALDRVEFAGLTKKNLKRGDYRILDQKEVNFLKMI